MMPVPAALHLLFIIYEKKESAVKVFTYVWENNLMEDSLEILIAKQEVTDVLVNYCHYLDRMELGSLGELFSMNCSVIYGEHPNLAAFGRVDLIKSLERMWRWQNTAHHISNISIKLVCKKKAQSQSYIYAWHEKPDSSTAVVFGRYIDQLERFSKGWQIV